ncbi:MAG: NAD(P)H-dependent oxidoreductase [Pseudomonadota bacterium]
MLHIDSSARTARSHSRRLSSDFVEAWLARVPDTRVIRRDVGANPPPAINEQWIASAFTAEAERSAELKAVLSISDAYIDELVRSDVIVMGAPMYNYGMPAALKAWFDQVVRVNRTFDFDPSENIWPLSPMLMGKTLVILSSRGEFGFEPGGIRQDWNHLETHIRTLQHYLGVETSHLIAVEYQEFGDKRHADSVARADRELQALVEQLTAPIGVAEPITN